MVSDHLDDDGTAGLVRGHPFDQPEVGLVVAEPVAGADLDGVSRVIEQPGAEPLDHQIHELVGSDDLEEAAHVGPGENPGLHRGGP